MLEAAKKMVLAKARKATAPIKASMPTNGKQMVPTLGKYPKAKGKQLTNGSSKTGQMIGTKTAPKMAVTAQDGRMEPTKNNTKANMLTTFKVWVLPTKEELILVYMRMPS